METKFKIGDRVECIASCEYVKRGAKGTIQKKSLTGWWILWDDKKLIKEASDNTWSKNEEYLKLITMELTVQKDRVLQEASKCSTFKRIAEGLWPEVFKPEQVYNNNMIYAFKGCGNTFWILNKIDGQFRWISICGMYTSEKETFQQACEAENFWKKGKVFRSTENFIQWCSEQL